MPMGLDPLGMMDRMLPVTGHPACGCRRPGSRWRLRHAKAVATAADKAALARPPLLPLSAEPPYPPGLGASFRSTLDEVRQLVC
jgi:hypothetical protein